MLPGYFVIIGTLIGASGSIAYLIDTAKGKIKGNRVFFYCCFHCTHYSIFHRLRSVGLEALMTFSTGFLPLTVFIASFMSKKAKWKLTGFDLLCGMISLMGLMLWMITKVGNIAIFFSIVADGFAAIPTIVKAYKYPDTELAWPWIATVFGIVLTLLTLSTFSFANCGFILYILVVNSLIFILVQFRIGEIRRSGN